LAACAPPFRPVRDARDQAQQRLLVRWWLRPKLAVETKIETRRVPGRVSAMVPLQVRRNAPQRGFEKVHPN